MDYLPLVAFAAVIVLLLVVAGRARRRQAVAAAALAERIGVGTDVMTTSGLHGTVVARNDDGTVQLAIAPGIEVRWEVAALRDAASLPDRRVTGPAGAPPSGGPLEASTSDDRRDDVR
ncbi:preprotein translocase subunit YajC [Jatrophihabitans fulvus]